MLTRIKNFIKQIIKSILFKYIITFLVAMVITIVIGLNFYVFWVMVIGLLGLIFGVFVPIVEKILDTMEYEIPPFLKNLPLNVKKGVLIACIGILFGGIFVFFSTQKIEKIND